MRIAKFNAFCRHTALLAFGALVSTGLGAAPLTVAAVVGEITTAIGQSQILTANGNATAQRGLSLRSGDRIETGVGGHVHIRFIDGGLVSVRPMSRLLIEDYRNVEGENLAAIKFRLEEGVMRSVTGQWGEAHRDRFRLNTPVVAIGVKGTDFVVKADGTSTLASVNSGAIVMAPLDGACASALGPCQGESAVLLSEDMQGTMLHYLRRSGNETPQLVPAIDLLALRTVPALQTPTTRQAGAPDIAGKTLVTDTSASSQLQAGVAQANKPLVWLHNTLNWNVPDHTISQRYSEAAAAGRTPAVGNFFISLYRDETIQKQFLPPATNVAFNLDSMSANYTQPNHPVEIVSVTNAQLNVDFAQTSLTTHMDLSSSSLGQASFNASATITPQGLFNSRNSQQNLMGAFSTTGDQAGYLFDKSFSGGKVSGLSLWSR